MKVVYTTRASVSMMHATPSTYVIARTAHRSGAVFTDVQALWYRDDLEISVLRRSPHNHAAAPGARRTTAWKYKEAELQ
jgi:hypothetical protein